MQLFKLLKQRRYLFIFILSFGLFFSLNYYLMAHLAGQRDLMCVLGGNLTGFNVTFAFLISFLASLIVVGFIENLKNRSLARSFQSGSTSFIGLILGTLTAFCTLCTLPVLTLFGFSIGLGFMTDYELYLKLASVVLLLIGLYLVNRELMKGCARCVS